MRRFLSITIFFTQLSLFHVCFQLGIHAWPVDTFPGISQASLYPQVWNMYPLHDLSTQISWDYRSVPFKTRSMQFFIHFLVGLGVGTSSCGTYSLLSCGLLVANHFTAFHTPCCSFGLLWEAPSERAKKVIFCLPLHLCTRVVSIPLSQAPPHQCFRCSAST